MAFEIPDSGFDNCIPPVCPEDVNIDLININCSVDKILSVDWTVTDIYNREVSNNSLTWSCDDISFNNFIITSGFYSTIPIISIFFIYYHKKSTKIRIL